MNFTVVMRMDEQKRFHNRETIPFIRISPLAEVTPLLSLLAEIIELRKG